MANPPEEIKSKSYDSQIVRRLLGYMYPYRASVALAIPLIVINSIIELIALNVTMVTLDLYLKPIADSQLPLISRITRNLIQSSGWQLTVGEALITFAVLYAVIIFLGFILSYSQSVLLNTMGQSIMYDMRKDIFTHLQRLPLQYYDRNPVGRMISRLTSDVDALNELMTAGLVTLFSDFLTLIGIIVFLFAVNWRLAAVLMLILPMMIVVTTWFRKNASIGFYKVRDRFARINAFFQEHITGMSVVQIFNREERELKVFNKINDDHRVANIETIFYYAVFYPAIGWISALGTALIVWYGGLQVLATTLTLGALVFFIQATQRFYEPIQDISEKYNVLQAAMAAADRIFSILDTPITIDSPENAQKLTEIRGAIEFRNVWFAYNNEDWVIKDLSFRIEPGQSLAIVGHTGAGKTSIINLLLRFYDIQRGQILIDGVDIKLLDLYSLRRAFGIVLQDVFLFSGDIAANITLGESNISPEAMRQAAKEVHADNFISKLPQGYQSEVTERGSTLSAGQRQLLSFARALAYDPKVLVLDEATSAVDTETELLIRDAVTKLLAGRTSVIIAHRLSTIQSADKIMVMHKGQLREMGSHQELLGQRGIYYKLHQLQYKEGSGVSRPVASD